MGKGVVITPLYISAAWVLLISYQMFTQTAVACVIQNVADYWPSIGNWLTIQMNVVVFVHTFAWVFVLSSLLPAIILGHRRSVLVQFLVCLTLAFAALSFADLFSLLVGVEFVEQIFKLAAWLENPLLAGSYLFIPYILMLSVDLRAKRKSMFERKEIAKYININRALIETQEGQISKQTDEKTS